MAQKKYVSLTRLSNFLDNIKAKYSQIGHKHTISDITNYTVDSSLSTTSTNPVQNKVLEAEFEAMATAMNILESEIDGKADSSHTHTHASLGQGMGYCSTAAATTAKIVSLLNYELTEGGVVTVEFVYGVPASATMNINGKGAQSIYYKGKAIENNIIKGGDRATFMYYSLRYHLISVDRWHKDIVDLQTNDRKVEQKVVTANANYPLLLAQSSQTADTTGFAYFDSGVYMNPSTNTIKANIDGTATGLKSLTATISELNYMDGVTSSVQTQLNNKSQVQIITWEAND